MFLLVSPFNLKVTFFLLNLECESTSVTGVQIYTALYCQSVTMAVKNIMQSFHTMLIKVVVLLCCQLRHSCACDFLMYDLLHIHWNLCTVDSTDSNEI